MIAFRMGLRQIDEDGVRQIMNHGKYGFVVISAHRNVIVSDNPENDLTAEYNTWCKQEKLECIDKNNKDHWLRKRNKEADADLFIMIKNSPYAYTPIYGNNTGSNNEKGNFPPSYILYCHARWDSKTALSFGKLYEFALSLAQQYKQESIYVHMPDEVPDNIEKHGSSTKIISTVQFEGMYRKAGPSSYFDRMKRDKLGEVFLNN